jgi:hypothetical protein
LRDPRRRRAQPPRPVLRDSPEPVVRRDRPPLRPTGQPLVADASPRRLHRRTPLAGRDRRAPRRRRRDHEPRQPGDGRGRRADPRRAPGGCGTPPRDRAPLPAGVGGRGRRVGVPDGLRAAEGQDRPAARGPRGALLWVLPNPSGLNPIIGSTHWLRRSASSAKPSPRARARRRS